MALQAGVCGAIVYTEQVTSPTAKNNFCQLVGATSKEPLTLDMAEVSTRDASLASDTASPPLSPGSAGANLLSCPWHDAMSYFLTSSDLGRVSLTCTAFRTELTVEDSQDKTEAKRRLLVVPVVELNMATAEDELGRVSLPHIHVLRAWSRMSLVSAANAVKSVGKEAFRSLDKFSLKGCPLNAFDVVELLVPMLAAVKRLQLLNLEKCQLQDAAIQRLCSSGMLNRVDTLNLRFNKIGDCGAASLSKCKAFSQMKWVNLKVNNITDTGAHAFAHALRHNRSMTLLNLRMQYPPLTDKAAEGFAEMLRTNNTLQQLRLRRNRISDAGAEALASAIAERLPRLCSRVPLWEEVCFELDVEDNRIGDSGALALLRTATAAPKRANVEILLSGNGVTRDSLCTAAAASGESLDSMDSRIIFSSKPETSD